MSALFLELARTIIFLSSPRHPHGEVAKTLPVVRLATKKLLLSVDAVDTVLPNCVLVRRSQRLENFVTDITGVNPFSLMYLSYHTIPSSNSLTNRPSISSGPGASRLPPLCFSLGGNDGSSSCSFDRLL